MKHGIVTIIKHQIHLPLLHLYQNTWMYKKERFGWLTELIAVLAAAFHGLDCICTGQLHDAMILFVTRLQASLAYIACIFNFQMIHE